MSDKTNATAVALGMAPSGLPFRAYRDHDGFLWIGPADAPVSKLTLLPPPDGGEDADPKAVLVEAGMTVLPPVWGTAIGCDTMRCYHCGSESGLELGHRERSGPLHDGPMIEEFYQCSECGGGELHTFVLTSIRTATAARKIG